MKSPLRRGGLRFFFVLIALAAGHTTYQAVLLGTPLILLGAALHIWAKGCLRQDAVLATTGPYAFVAHPFYLANALIDAGIAVMSGWWLLWILLPAWWAAIYLPVIRREEKHLTEIFGAEYESYRARVPALLPSLRRLAKSRGGFSWHNPNISRGVEVPRVLRILAYPLLFFVSYQVRADGLKFLTDTYCLELWAMALGVILYGLSWELTLHIKHRQRILPPEWTRAGVRAAFAALMLVVAVTIPQLDTELDLLVMPPGFAMVGFSALAFFGRARRDLALEGLALVGVVVLCEALWLTAIPILFYAAIVLDSRLESRVRASEPPAPAHPLLAAHPGLYQLIVGVGLFTWLTKELLVG